MISAQIEAGRAVMVVVQPGEDLFAELLAACRHHRIQRAYLPVFLGAFSTISLIGTCDPIADPLSPLADQVHLDNVEGSGSGTLSIDPGSGQSVAHLHAAVGVKRYAANGYAGHVLAATVQYVAELVVQEVLSPEMTRRVHPGSGGLAILDF